jgi:uncharacterized membrane protein YfcA
MAFDLIVAGLVAVQEHVALHVLTCLIPAFLLAGAMVAFINKEAIMARIATATNSLAVTLPSFSAFAAHCTTARLDLALLGTTAVTSIIGAQLGAVFMTRRVKSKTLELVAGLLIVLAIQRVWLLLR